MANPTSEQVRYALTVDSKQKFRIDVEVIDKGDLPDDKFFVRQIIDPDDAKGDTFARVATIADFAEITTDRPTAINDLEDYYRSPIFTFYYDDLATANAAQDVLKSRIDELVTDWITYQQDFVAYPTAEVTIHPRYTLSAYESAVDAYKSALTAEATALTTRDEAKGAYDDAVADAATAAAAVTTAQTALTECQTAKGWFDALYTAMASPNFYAQAETLRAAAETYRIATTGTNPVAEGVFVTARNTFSGQQNTAQTTLTTALSNQASFAIFCTQKETDLTTAQLQVPFNDIFNKYRTDVAAGGGPDMFVAPNDSLDDDARAGLIADITDLAAGKLEGVNQLGVDGMSLDGKLYGIPETLKAVAFWYNKSLLPTPPATTDELKALMEGGTEVSTS